MEARWVFKGKGLEAPGLEGNMTQYDQSRKLSQPVSGGDDRILQTPCPLDGWAWEPFQSLFKHTKRRVASGN